MKKYFLAIIAVCLLLHAHAQSGYFTVTGKVTDAISKQPLQGASVFAQNTTLGTATDAAGNFRLTLPNGGYDLVFTFTGYQTDIHRISSTDAATANIDAAMKVKEKALEDVVITSSNEVKNGWEKYGSFFLQNFIGESESASHCTIKNKEALKFYFSKKRNRLKVLANDPVEIENNYLGYNIKYTVDSFTYEYNTQVSLYTGYPLFEEMHTTDSLQQKKWEENRANAYKGSLLHFMRSIYNKRLKEEGFEIQFLVKYNDKDTAIRLPDFYGALNYKKDDSTQTVEIWPNQNTVAIIYNKAKPEPAYLTANPDDPAGFQLSQVAFLPGQSLIIEANGYYYEQTDITTYQYMGWKKMGDMLPYDYQAP
ncbi:MAG: carboxypeptidase-like regulatory domain-containing protein [Bacteroidetes bacterium]|nr:carboxypeptidase-like regulatory domain-containing protein [Bacteroidota bacterium]